MVPLASKRCVHATEERLREAGAPTETLGTSLGREKKRQTCGRSWGEQMFEEARQECAIAEEHDCADNDSWWVRVKSPGKYVVYLDPKSAAKEIIAESKELLERLSKT